MVVEHRLHLSFQTSIKCVKRPGGIAISPRLLIVVIHLLLLVSSPLDTAKLIHHDGNRFLLLHKELHQFIGGHGFGHNRYLLHILMPVFRSTKHFRRMDITHHIVDISIVHNDLGNSGFDEAAFQLVQ